MTMFNRKTDRGGRKVRKPSQPTTTRKDFAVGTKESRRFEGVIYLLEEQESILTVPDSMCTGDSSSQKNFFLKLWIYFEEKGGRRSYAKAVQWRLESSGTRTREQGQTWRQVRAQTSNLEFLVSDDENRFLIELHLAKMAKSPTLSFPCEELGLRRFLESVDHGKKGVSLIRGVPMNG